VATTTHHEISKTAEDTAKDPRHAAPAIMDYVGRVGEINTEMAERTAQVWVEGLRKQMELSQRMTRRFFDRSIEQAYIGEESFGPGWWAPYSYDPFGLWRTWALTLRATYETGRDAQQSAAQTAQDTQRTAAEETARVIETTAPKNGSFPIADYDEKTVEEITSRLDALTDEQLRRVKDYEWRTKNRETLLQQIERRIQRAS